MSANFWNGIIGQHAASQMRVSEPVAPDTYRGWDISYCAWTNGLYATGPGYDASYEGPEDGWVDNGEWVSARTREALIEEIDAWFEEHEA